MRISMKWHPSLTPRVGRSRNAHHPIPPSYEGCLTNALPYGFPSWPSRPIKTRRLVLEGRLLSAERSDIRSRDRSFLDLVLEVGPDAAAAILAAYKNGRLHLARKLETEHELS